MTDRYANGDPANDRGGRDGHARRHGLRPGRHGLVPRRRLAASPAAARPARGLARIQALGFTAVWVTPPFGQKAVQGSSAAYHGYWIRDFTSVDPHLGTNADFAAFVECAHRLGLKVYLDVVVNHTADIVVPRGSGYVRLPYRDCHGKLFSPARYAAADLPLPEGRQHPARAGVLAGDRNAKKPAWLNDVRRYHNRGDIDFASCSETCFEQGDFFGLDDLFTEQPAVVARAGEVYGDWIRRYKVDGFRVDTARHVDKAFFRVWAPKILAAARAAGVPDFELFGEVFVSDAIELSSFVRDAEAPERARLPVPGRGQRVCRR